MRPRTISLVVTFGVFLGGLALVWALSGGAGGGGGRSNDTGADQVFTFPLNSTTKRVSVRSHWQLGHMTPQDDQVELTLDGSCATAHLYAYLSTGWDHGPLVTASLILGTSLHPTTGVTPPRVVRSDENVAILLSRQSERGVLVQRAAPRDYDALLISWNGKQGCDSFGQKLASRELGRLFETFTVISPEVGGPRLGAG